MHENKIHETLISYILSVQNIFSSEFFLSNHLVLTIQLFFYNKGLHTYWFIWNYNTALQLIEEEGIRHFDQLINLK